MQTKAFITHFAAGKKAEPINIVLFASFTGLLRGLLEGLLFDNRLLDFQLCVTNIAFYLVVFYSIQWILIFFGGHNPNAVARIPLASLFLGLLPPIIDLVVTSSRSTGIQYGYYLDLFQSQSHPRSLWIFYIPEKMLPLGESVTIWLSILLSGFFSFSLKRDLFRTALVLVGAYLIFVCHGIFLPSFLQYLKVKAAHEQLIIELNLIATLVQIILTFGLYFSVRKISLMYTCRRILHILPNLLVFLIGSTFRANTAFTTTVFAVFLALIFMTLVAQNDFHDRCPDQAQGRRLHFKDKDVFFLNFLAGFGIAVIAIHNFVPGSFMLIILICGFLYNYPFYEGKKRIFSAMKIEGIWGAMSFFSGAVMSKTAPITNETLIHGLLIFSGWSVFSWLKDIKDVRTDRKFGTQTIYVLSWRKGVPLRTAHRIIYSFIASLLFLPPLFFALWQEWISAGALGLSALLFCAHGFTRLNSSWFLRTLGVICFYLTVFYVLRVAYFA